MILLLACPTHLRYFFLMYLYYPMCFNTFYFNGFLHFNLFINHHFTYLKFNDFDLVNI